MFRKVMVATVAALMLVIAPAQASVVGIDPGDSNLLTPGTTFLSGVESKTPTSSFVDEYSFLVNDLYAPYSVTAQTTMGVINGDPTTTGFGIANLTFSFTDATNSVLLKEFVLTDAAGMALGSLATLVSKVVFANLPADLLISVSGDTLANGGAYSLAIATVPVPAALPLLAGGIALLGFVGRRRQRNALKAA